MYFSIYLFESHARDRSKWPANWKFVRILAGQRILYKFNMDRVLP